MLPQYDKFTMIHIYISSYNTKINLIFLNLISKKNKKIKINESYIPVYLATPLNVISSIIVGSERPLAFTANNTIR